MPSGFWTWEQSTTATALTSLAHSTSCHLTAFPALTSLFHTALCLASSLRTKEPFTRACCALVSHPRAIPATWADQQCSQSRGGAAQARRVLVGHASHSSSRSDQNLDWGTCVRVYGLHMYTQDLVDPMSLTVIGGLDGGVERRCGCSDRQWCLCALHAVWAWSFHWAGHS
jgi:hypothetical protein